MKKLTALVALTAVVMTGCFGHSITVGKGASTNGSPRYSKWQSHFIFGLIGEGEVDVSQVCPSGNAVVEDYHSFVNMIIGALIGIIYWPTTIEIYCDDRSAKLELTPAQMRAIGQSKAFEMLLADVAPERMGELVAAREQNQSVGPVALACTK